MQLLCRRDALTTKETFPTSVVCLFAAHTDGTPDSIRKMQIFQGFLEQLEQIQEKKAAVSGDIHPPHC